MVFAPSSPDLISSHVLILTGIVRVEQKNNTLLEMGFYDDGPYEVGDESRLDPELVPVPANSYLGKFKLYVCLYNICLTCIG